MVEVFLRSFFKAAGTVLGFLFTIVVWIWIIALLTPRPALSAPVQVFSGLGDMPAYHVQDLAGRIRARGCAVETHAWTAAPMLTARLKNAHGPIRLVGYSMGGNAVIELARSLAPRRVTVVTIDPNVAIGARPSNADVLNIYKPGPLGGGIVAGAHNVQIAWVDHLSVPHLPTVISRTVRTVCP